MRVNPSEMSAVLRMHDRMRPTGFHQNQSTAAADGLENVGVARAPHDDRRMKECDSVLVETCSEYNDVVFKKTLPFPYLFVATTPEAVVLERYGDVQSVREADRDGIARGQSLGLDSKGVNCFSIATVLRRPLFVEKNDHSVHSLKRWNAFVFPLNGPDGLCAGLLGFLFLELPFGPGAGPLLRAIARKMELTFIKKMKSRLLKSHLFENVEENLIRLGLTEREREVASYWILDYDYKQISKAIGISEHTVRSIIYKINSKLNVNSKASMILRIFEEI